MKLNRKLTSHLPMIALMSLLAISTNSCSTLVGLASSIINIPRGILNSVGVPVSTKGASEVLKAIRPPVSLGHNNFEQKIKQESPSTKELIARNTKHYDSNLHLIK